MKLKARITVLWWRRLKSNKGVLMFFIPLPILLIEILAFTTFVHFYNFWDVFLAYLLPSFAGAVLFSLTGRSIMMSLQGGLAQGQMPADRVLHRGAVLVGAILLIIPLFLSRVMALLLIIPGLRHLCIFIFKTYLFQRFAKSRFSFVRFGGFGAGPGNAGGDGGFQRGGPFPYEPEVRHERDVEVVNVTPIEITHTKISEEAPKKKEDSSED